MEASEFRRLCIVHEEDDPNDEHITYYICADCMPSAKNLLANLELENETGLLDPNDADNPAVAAFRILSALTNAKPS